jgi:cytochrome oxidase Cu insertion factor (SCO1/SenC/PrrC family)
MEAGAGVRGRPRRVSLGARVAGLLLLAALIGLGVGVGVRERNGARKATPSTVVRHYGLYGEATWAQGARAAPMINTLPDQTGRLFSLASLRGRTVAIAFFDSHCHQECPLEGRALAAAELSLPAAQRPVLVAVSINPADTPASAARAASAWGLAAVAPWHWLMGPRRQLAPVWAAYHIYVSSHPINGDISHTEALFLVDRRGYERSAYLWPFAPRFVTLDLRTLARGAAGS